MLKNIKITQKFPIIIITFALVSALITGVIAYSKTTSSMEYAVKQKLVSLLESRKASLHNYFETTVSHVSSHSQNTFVINALSDFSVAWKLLNIKQEDYLQRHYIQNNPYPMNQRYLLNTANDDSMYSSVHEHFHPELNRLMHLDDFYDLFLIDTDGNIIYTSEKELDFATNLKTGRYKDTYLAGLFRDIDVDPILNNVHITDFSPYSPSNNEPASFIGSAVFDSNNRYIGVLALQMPIEPIDKIMHVTAGMGLSGETYIVGPDFLMRSNSRFDKAKSHLKTLVDTKSIREGLNNNSGVHIVDSYHHVPVYSAFSPFNILSLRWVVLAEIDEEEVLEPVYEMGLFLLFSGLLISLVIFIIGYYLSFDISRPIVLMTKVMKKLSNNELKTDIPIENRKDEIGEMADAMTVLKQYAIERNKLQKELLKISEIDSLTGLYTRKYIMDKFDQLINQAPSTAKKLVVMFIDLDNFKSINDQLGHDIGDRTLCNIARYLTSSVRHNDIVARIGGDEFIILFPNVMNENEINPIAMRILQVLRTDPLPLTVSIGLSVYPDNANNAALLLKQADSAMYEVKNGGKNNFAFWKDTMVE